jgi:4-hydroxy-2-oxoheptanedioate aldolase
MPVSAYLKQANAETFVVIQLEDDAGVANAYEIASVPGVDAIMLGPGDYSAAGGFPGEMDHPRIVEATHQIALAARSAGKHWGMPAATAEHAAQLIGAGACFIAHSADLLILKNGLARIQAEFSEIGFTFDNRLSRR